MHPREMHIQGEMVEYATTICKLSIEHCTAPPPPHDVSFVSGAHFESVVSSINQSIFCQDDSFFYKISSRRVAVHSYNSENPNTCVVTYIFNGCTAA